MRFWPFVLLLLAAPALAQTEGFTAVRGEVRFDRPLRAWDGFGVNYVEEAQSRDRGQPQEYGGFHLLTEEDRRAIVELLFGEDGLRPGLVKMFLDPFHQESVGGPYDHESTTENMRFFVREGLKATRARGADLSIITTLYGPPAYMTRQKVLRGRDLDPAHAGDLADYLVSWVRFLREDEGLPVDYVSLHNEGESWRRWPEDGGDGPGHLNHDYNLYWPPELVVDFLDRLPRRLREAGLGDVGVTPGETYGWDHFSDWGYADAIADDAGALAGLGLITAHGFQSWGWGRWNNVHTSRGVDVLRARRPDLHAWVTSTSWKGMDVEFIREIWGNVYVSKVNGLIPWAAVQRPGKWVGGDPNSGCAIWVHDEGRYEVRKGYHYFKQVSRAGQPGTRVCRTMTMDATVKLLAFAGGDKHPDAFVLLNLDPTPRRVTIVVVGSRSRRFAARRTSDPAHGDESYRPVGAFDVRDGSIRYEAPPRSVTTFFGE
jgi:O-glycosyl hydrolase